MVTKLMVRRGEGRETKFTAHNLYGLEFSKGAKWMESVWGWKEEYTRKARTCQESGKKKKKGAGGGHHDRSKVLAITLEQSWTGTDAAYCIPQP
jgi:hypothetical protein